MKRWATCKLTLTQNGESSAASGKSSAKSAKNGDGRMNFVSMRRWMRMKSHKPCPFYGNVGGFMRTEECIRAEEETKK